MTNKKGETLCVSPFLCLFSAQLGHWSRSKIRKTDIHVAAAINPSHSAAGAVLPHLKIIVVFCPLNVIGEPTVITLSLGKIQLQIGKRWIKIGQRPIAGCGDCFTEDHSEIRYILSGIVPGTGSIVRDDLPIESDWEADFIVLQKSQRELCFLTCFIYGQSLGEEIHTDI